MLARMLTLVSSFVAVVVSGCSASIETRAEGADGSKPTPAPQPSATLPDPGVRLAQGARPKCVKKANGSVTCFGYYAGDTSATDPVDLVGIDDAVEVVQFLEQGCVLHATGKVSCWGWSHHSQLGLAIEPYTGTSAIPIELPEVELVHISSGHHAVCGLRASGQAVCWGGAYAGPLGDPSVDETQAPVAVIGVEDAIDLSAAIEKVCAVRSSGKVACWVDRASAIDVPGIEGASRVATGWTQACAIVDGGAAVCWDDATPAAAVPSLQGVAQLSGGDGYMCARRSEGSVACWVDDATGHGAPVDVAIDDAIDVAVIGYGEGACAVRASGAIVCWKPGAVPTSFP